MGCGAVVENAVSLTKFLVVIPYTNLHFALYHIVEFLTFMGGGVDRSILQFLAVCISAIVGLTQLFPEFRSKIIYVNALFS